MASSSVSKKLYDAFISHRGPDVKETVAFALYESLEEMGFWTFLDDQELQLGDSIEPSLKNAIYYSSAQIAIFSPGYAESPWCLDELVDMLKTKVLFIPVFCDVDPSDLRYPDKGVYAPAFAKHQKKKRFSKERLQQWKAALHSSSLISGYKFNTSSDNVEMLCAKIVLAMQQGVGKPYVFPRHGEVAKHKEGLHSDAAASTSTSAQVKKSSLLPRDSRPVGLESKVKGMVELLKNPEVKFIAVVGMGGSGKTFLLQNVYKAVKRKYHHSVWLSISKSYSLKNLQRDIAADLDLTREIVNAEVTEKKAAELIHARLKGKKSLIVFDDLWAFFTEDNLIDNLGLPADRDCKVMISTRNEQVALDLSARIYKMEFLSDEESWRLFCAYAFPECEGNRAPPHVKEEGRKIVKQCGNLPLAIKTIAASLSNTRVLSKWALKRHELERVVAPSGEINPVMKILKLSYDSLPAHLKPCFAYLSFFPEDAEIKAEYLIYLWLGEGIVPAGEEQWDVAWDWLDQLAQLCLLQVYEDFEAFSFIDRHNLNKYCKIHDLLHDLAIQISKENKCAFSVEEVSTHTIAATGWCRILLAKKGVCVVKTISESHPVYLRTLSLSQNEITSIPTNLFTTMRGLRVLDLSSTKISTLPASVGKMILLKVLNLRDTDIGELPECVRHLKSLLYLALPNGCTQLPEWISELQCLQCLEGWHIDRMPKGISKLTSLRALRSSYAFSKEEVESIGLGGLANMTQLQELSLVITHEMQMKRIEQGTIAQLVKMRRLDILNDTCEETELLQLPENIITSMKHLESLRLGSDYPELQKMPNLVLLKLMENKSCRELPDAFGESGGFPQLRYLEIYDFPLLEEFPELEGGTMPCLENLVLEMCPKVRRVKGLEKLQRLQECSIEDVTQTFRRSYSGRILESVYGKKQDPCKIL
ncbi:hypothetical protein SUGI_0755440 [Cryptomeria japonica]|nr:hypothetical protein SUGI_0755440 [Cryptomeria japonica]